MSSEHSFKGDGKTRGKGAPETETQVTEISRPPGSDINLASLPQRSTTEETAP